MPLPTCWRAAVPVAASSLSADLVHGAPTTATVLAAHRFGIYLDVARSVLPVVTSDAVPLPTALRLARGAGSVDWSVVAGDGVQVGDGRVVLPSAELVAVRTWRPARVTRVTRGPQDPVRSVEVEVAGPRWLEDGIRDAVLSSFGAGCSAGCPTDLQGTRLLTDAVGRLVGRGPGLTPSGDDALAGALLVGHGLSTAGRLAAAVRERLPATTAVSAALLEAAADGYAARPVVTLVDAVLSGDDEVVAAALPSVLRIGHTSGHDLVSGIRSAVDVHVAHSRPAPPTHCACGRWEAA